MKIIIYILFLMILSACTLGNNNISVQSEITNKTALDDVLENIPPQQEHCERRADINIDLDNLFVSQINNKISKQKPFGFYTSCGNYERVKVNLTFDTLNKDILGKLQETRLITGFYDYEMYINIHNINNQEILYDFIKYINKNISIYSIDIKVQNQNLKIDKKLFGEILQNSRFAYHINLDFSEDIKQIDILRSIKNSNIASFITTEYKRGIYFETSDYIHDTFDFIAFQYKGKKAIFEIIDGREIFNYSEGPGSERIPFEYGE